MSTTTGNKSAAELFGIPEVPKKARDRLIETAIDLCYHHGFNAVGLDQILDEVGLTKTTFYKYFESKDDLLVEAIKKRDAWEADAWHRAVRALAGDDPRGQLLAIFDVMDIWFNDPEFNGCLFINAAAEFPNPHDPVHKAAAAHKVRVRDEIRDMAAKLNADDPEVFADRYAMILEGTLIVRQVHGNNNAARTARAMVKTLIEDHIPPRVEADST
jgi:AcrR family transcriptional regulator